MTHVLVLASEVVPLPGLPTVGGGLRGWTLARGLESAGFRVTLVFPREPLEALAGDFDAAAIAAALPMTFAWHDPAAAIRRFEPDIVVCCSWLLASHLTACPVPLAVDLAGPVLLEFIYQGAEKAIDLGWHKTSGLARADFVTCAGERQRNYFMAWLVLAGFSPEALATAVATVPISAPPNDAPLRDPANDEPTIVFAGLALPWQDPVPPLRATLRALDRVGRGKLATYITEHPVHSQGVRWVDWLREQSRDHPRVVAHEQRLRPYDELRRIYGAADLAFDLFLRNPERDLAVNTRTIDYLACDTPPLYVDYAELTALIRAYDAGIIVDPSDEAAVEVAVSRALTDAGWLVAKRRGARRLVTEHLAWSRTIAPLAQWCAAPRRREPVTPPGTAAEYHLRAELADTRKKLAVARNDAAVHAAHIGEVEAVWQRERGWNGDLSAALATWHGAPWRSAARQTFDRLRARLRPGQPAPPDQNSAPQ